MKNQEIKTRIEELNSLITENVKSGNNSVENAAAWCRMVKERSNLKEMLNEN
jgi:hypothetical protein